jgi:hypothetical protein
MTGLETGRALHEQIGDAAADRRKALGVAAPDEFIEASVHFPKFVFHLSTHRSQTSESHGASKPTTLVPLFHLKFLNGICRLWRRNFKWAALVEWI